MPSHKRKYDKNPRLSISLKSTTDQHVFAVHNTEGHWLCDALASSKRDALDQATVAGLKPAKAFKLENPTEATIDNLLAKKNKL